MDSVMKRLLGQCALPQNFWAIPPLVMVMITMMMMTYGHHVRIIRGFQIVGFHAALCWGSAAPAVVVGGGGGQSLKGVTKRS